MMHGNDGNDDDDDDNDDDDARGGGCERFASASLCVDLPFQMHIYIGRNSRLRCSGVGFVSSIG